MTTGVLGSGTRTESFADAHDERRLVRWGLPIVVFLASRVVSTLLLLHGAGQQIQLTAANFPFFMARDFPVDPGYLDVITTWDGQYYQYLAQDGYGSSVPGDTQLDSKQLAWAFPPGFPLVIRALVWLTGAPFAVVATVLNVVLGTVAMVLLYGLVRRHADRFAALAVVATTSFFVSAPLFQTAYSESLALLLLVLALRDIDSRTWWRAALWTVLLSLVRIITPPLALVVVVVLWRQRRSTARWSRTDLVGGGVVASLAAGGALFWSVLTRFAEPSASAGGGVAADAASDRTSNLAVLTVRWIQEAHAYWGVGGLVFMTLLVAAVVMMPLTRYGRSLGPAVSTWLWAYPLFLFSVTLIQPGMLRYFLLAPGLLVPLLSPVRRTRRAKWVVLAVLLVLLVLAQRWFVNELLVIDSLEQGFGP
ncbi:hypothetical protein [Oryzobacter telluris]|uniref:hypothetical protein n=1 Tax=Oryzobacter telluris TaxID=3149179 RepID=UPI00370D54D7